MGVFYFLYFVTFATIPAEGEGRREGNNPGSAEGDSEGNTCRSRLISKL
jgi:hypothetical protein